MYTEDVLYLSSLSPSSVKGLAGRLSWKYEDGIEVMKMVSC